MKKKISVLGENTCNNECGRVTVTQVGWIVAKGKEKGILFHTLDQRKDKRRRLLLSFSVSIISYIPA